MAVHVHSNTTRLQLCRHQRSKIQRVVQIRASANQARIQTFPKDYTEAIRQAQEATRLAIQDGLQLLEVEFPSTSLYSVAGDGEGQNEMNASMEFLRQFLNGFRESAPTTRVFFPDDRELAVARQGQTSDPAAGRVEMDPKFDNSRFKFGYLVKQNSSWAMLGVNLFKNFSPVELVQDSDKLFVVAYPSFNPREELAATAQLWREAAASRGAPVVVFNGELDRIRGGYYAALFFPELAALARDFIPKFEASYYIRNFKGTRPGVLFRAYPGPWQVLRRNPVDETDVRLVWVGSERPTLREVATDILPNCNQELQL